jgi:hypothetical protein
VGMDRVNALLSSQAREIFGSSTFSAEPHATFCMTLEGPSRTALVTTVSDHDSI